MRFYTFPHSAQGSKAVLRVFFQSEIKAPSRVRSSKESMEYIFKAFVDTVGLEKKDRTSINNAFLVLRYPAFVIWTLLLLTFQGKDINNEKTDVNRKSCINAFEVSLTKENMVVNFLTAY